MQDLKTNMGEVLKDYMENSKEGKKLQKQKQMIEDAKEILKTLDHNESFEIVKEKVLSLLTKMYRGHHLENQVSYLNKKRTSIELVQQAFYVVIGKQDQYEKSRRKLEEEFEGN